MDMDRKSAANITNHHGNSGGNSFLRWFSRTGKPKDSLSGDLNNSGGFKNDEFHLTTTDVEGLSGSRIKLCRTKSNVSSGTIYKDIEFNRTAKNDCDANYTKISNTSTNGDKSSVPGEDSVKRRRRYSFHGGNSKSSKSSGSQLRKRMAATNQHHPDSKTCGNSPITGENIIYSYKEEQQPLKSRSQDDYVKSYNRPAVAVPHKAKTPYRASLIKSQELNECELIYEEKYRYRQSNSNDDRDRGLSSRKHVQQHSSLKELHNEVVEGDYAECYVDRKSLLLGLVPKVNLEMAHSTQDLILEVSHQKQSSYAHSEGYHSYVSSNDSAIVSPFLDRLPPYDETSHSKSTSEIGYVSSTLSLNMSSGASVSTSIITPPQPAGIVVRSARVQIPQRHPSESVVYYAPSSDPSCSSGASRTSISSDGDVVRLPQTFVMGHGNSPVSSTITTPTTATTTTTTTVTKSAYLDPQRKRRVSDENLKVIQKEALLNYYKRHHQRPPPVPLPPQLTCAKPRLPTPPSRTSSSSDSDTNNQDYPMQKPAPLEACCCSCCGVTCKRCCGQDTVIRLPHPPKSINESSEGPAIIGRSIRIDDWEPPELPPRKTRQLVTTPNIAPPSPNSRVPPSPEQLPPPPINTVTDDNNYFMYDSPFPPPPAPLELIDAPETDVLTNDMYRMDIKEASFAPCETSNIEEYKEYKTTCQPFNLSQQFSSHVSPTLSDSSIGSHKSKIKFHPRFIANSNSYHNDDTPKSISGSRISVPKVKSLNPEVKRDTYHIESNDSSSPGSESVSSRKDTYSAVLATVEPATPVESHTTKVLGNHHQQSAITNIEEVKENHSHLNNNQRFVSNIEPKMDSPKALVEYLKDAFLPHEIAHVSHSHELDMADQSFTFAAWAENNPTPSLQFLPSTKKKLLHAWQKKLDSMIATKETVTKRCRMNDALGEILRCKVTDVASTRESAKFDMHVREIGDVTNLLLGLCDRLKKTDYALSQINGYCSEMETMENKRNRLVVQIEEAKTLKANIDKRSDALTILLSKYFSPEELSDYKRFIQTKSRLLIEKKEISESIERCQEKLAKLNATSI